MRSAGSTAAGPKKSRAAAMRIRVRSVRSPTILIVFILKSPGRSGLQFHYPCQFYDVSLSSLPASVALSSSKSGQAAMSTPWFSGDAQCPPIRRMRTVRQASASGDRCRDSCFGLIGRHADVDVGPATPRPRRAEALERHIRVTSVPIDDVFFRSEAPVPEGSGPERTDVAACILCDRNAHDLDLDGVRRDPQLPSFCRDLACQLDITMAQSSVLTGGGPDRDSLGSHVNVGEVAHDLRSFGDRGHEPCRFRERSDAEVGVGAREEDPPVLDSDGVVECPSSRSLLAHGAMLGRNSITHPRRTDRSPR